MWEKFKNWVKKDSCHDLADIFLEFPMCIGTEIVWKDGELETMPPSTKTIGWFVGAGVILGFLLLMSLVSTLVFGFLYVMFNFVFVPFVSLIALFIGVYCYFRNKYNKEKEGIVTDEE